MATRREDIKPQLRQLPARIRTILKFSDGTSLVTDDVALIQPYSGIAAGFYARVNLDEGNEDE